MSDRLDEIAKRHADIQRISEDVRTKLQRTVARLLSKYPGEQNIVMRQLEGLWQEMLSEREKLRRASRRSKGNGVAHG